VGPPSHGATTVLGHLMRPSYPERMLARLAQQAKVNLFIKNFSVTNPHIAVYTW
jgi:hypothetical protein